MGKGGAPQPTDQTVVQSNLPKYVRPYFERLLERTEAESKREYEPYQGSRFARAGEDVTSAQQQIRDISGRGIAGLPAAQAATTAGLGRALQGMGYQAGQFDSAAAQQYMSPYMQQVVDVQKERAILDAQRQGAGRAAQAVQAGGFWGQQISRARGNGSGGTGQAAGRNTGFGAATGI